MFCIRNFLVIFLDISALLTSILQAFMVFLFLKNNMFHMLLLLKRTKTTNFNLSDQIAVTVKVKIQSQLEENSSPVLIADIAAETQLMGHQGRASQQWAHNMSTSPMFFLQCLSVGFSDMFIYYSPNPLAHWNMERRFG